MSSWEAVYDDNGQTYYYNSSTGETSWDRPFDMPNLDVTPSSSSNSLPLNWKEVTDENGSIYYYNEVTFETSWTFPSSTEPSRSIADTIIITSMESSSSTDLPPGWQEVTDENGNTYFYNTNTNETAWERPSESKSISSSNSGSSLPAGWQALVDENGTTYYFNEATNETSWDPPISEKLILDFSSINVPGAISPRKDAKKDKKKEEDKKKEDKKKEEEKKEGRKTKRRGKTTRR